MAAGAIDWSSAQIKNYLYTHAIKVFEESRETFFKKFLWSPKAKEGVGELFQKAPPTKNIFHATSVFPKIFLKNAAHSFLS